MKKYRRKENETEYIPINTEKYCGQYPIICRSTWEEAMCRWLDYNKDVIEWSSEGHRIPYFDGTSGKTRIYYPDFYAMFRNRNKYIIEVKPTKYLRMPKKKGKKSNKTMMMREHTFLVNQAKIKAAKQYCKKLGYKFVVITEKELFRKMKI